MDSIFVIEDQVAVILNLDVRRSGIVASFGSPESLSVSIVHYPVAVLLKEDRMVGAALVGVSVCRPDNLRIIAISLVENEVGVVLEDELVFAAGRCSIIARVEDVIHIDSVTHFDEILEK